MTSSLGNNQTFGAVEVAVKVVKHLMQKCRASKEDPFLGLLNLQNAPARGLNALTVGPDTEADEINGSCQRSKTTHNSYSAQEAWRKQERRRK